MVSDVKMRWLFLALWLLPACWTGSSTPAAEPSPTPVVAPRVADAPAKPPRVTSERSASLLATMHGFTDRMCQCFDKACSDQVVEEMVAWGREIAKTMDANNRASDEDQKEMAQVSEALTKCMLEIKKRSMPPPGPAQPAPTP